MADIYNDLVKIDFRNVPDNELNSVINHAEDSVAGLMAGLQAMGSLAFWAVDSANYQGEMVRNDLRGMGEMLMYLPRIVEALNDTAFNAKHEQKARKRNGGKGNE